MKRVRNRRLGMRVLLLLGGATMFGSCNGPLGREFRSVAGQGLQEGVTSIADSLIAGVFAVLTPNPTSDSTSDSR